MSLQPKTYVEALEKARNRPQKARKPMARGKGIQRGSRSLGAKQRSALGATAKRKGKRKKLTDGQLKKKVWREFSIFIRTRGADEEGKNWCVTCGIRLPWKMLHAGHFLRGRLNANLFDGRGCHPQCYGCNVGRDGNVVEYYEWMEKYYGRPVIAQLRLQNNQTHKWQAGELAELFEKYRALNAANPLIKENL